MIFDENGFPRDTGASDFQDSSRLAGIMATFDYPNTPDLQRYIVSGQYRRHPTEKRYSMSRDQTICLFSGYKAQQLGNLVDRDYATEGDLVSPSVRNHFIRCAGGEGGWLGDQWLYLDIAWNAWVKPMEEPNQLICILWNADDKYLQLWVKMNPKWRQAINLYWCGWRKEPELAAHMISKIERRLSYKDIYQLDP